MKLILFIFSCNCGNYFGDYPGTHCNGTHPLFFRDNIPQRVSSISLPDVEFRACPLLVFGGLGVGPPNDEAEC